MCQIYIYRKDLLKRKASFKIINIKNKKSKSFCNSFLIKCGNIKDQTKSQIVHGFVLAIVMNNLIENEYNYVKFCLIFLN